MRRLAILGLVLGVAACAVRPPPPPLAPAPPVMTSPPVESPAAPAPAVSQAQPEPGGMRCDNGRRLVLRPQADQLDVDGLAPGPQELLRDAGGIGPRQSVWSNDRVRVALGLGDRGDEALVQLLGVDAAPWRCRPEASP
jgi:hypothetical protein